MNFKTRNLIFFTLLFSVISSGQDLSDFDLSQLTPEQIRTINDALSDQSIDFIDSEDPIELNESLVINEKSTDSNKLDGAKFGYDFFASMPTSLSAVGDLPLPNDYKISLRDQFTIILSGSKNAVFDLSVKLDGSILFPELGAMRVEGLTFGEVSEKLSKKVKQSYVGVDIDVSLKKLSAKKITIVGAVKTPGTYLVNPFSTITGALAFSGGISEIGTLRNIKLIRNNGKVFNFDLYDLLINGDRSNDLTIEAGDTILIGAASQFVEVRGQVRRPATYEVLPNETIKDVIDFSLGFTEISNKSNVSVERLDLESSSVISKTVKDLNQELENVILVQVFGYVSQKNSDIRVIGAVEEPGFYEVEKYQNLEDLINDLNFVDEYPWLAALEQYDKDNYIKTINLINLEDKETYKNINLQPNSKLIVANINEMTYAEVSEDTLKTIADYKLSINHKGQTYSLPVYGKFKVETFVNFLGLEMDDVSPVATYISPLENLVMNMDFKDMNFEAKKYHNISFRSPINDLIKVKISGSVEFPGEYTLTSNTTLRELYNLIGEFKPEAYKEGIIFFRESIRRQQLDAINKSQREIDQAVLSNIVEGNDLVDIELIKSLSSTINPENLGRVAGNYSPNSNESLEIILYDGDEIMVPVKSSSINILGEVLNPTSIIFEQNLSVQKAVEMAGGFQETSDRSRVYVIKANGLVVPSSRNIFKGRVNLMPGDTIVVPRKIVIENTALEALIPITNVLSNLAFSAAAIDNLSNN
tara:strand:- start:3182 stop:5455 length:2274 start_codon:yes stop_codon:yes gene_type:complete